MEHQQIIAWLRESDQARLDKLWHDADAVRRSNVGDEVHLRGLIEFSNNCRRQCAYCGLRAGNKRLKRYRLSDTQIFACVRLAVELGYGTVVLQSGEEPALEARWMSRLIRRIKAETPLAVTLSLGERSEEELALWRAGGADRYLLRFETSNRALYERIHPPRPGIHGDRLAMIETLDRLGYEKGSGVMIGIPGQSYQDLARDIGLFGSLGLDMIGVGPFLRHPDASLADASRRAAIDADCQVPADDLTTCKVIALSRLICPEANIPATTALATVNKSDGMKLGLTRGANVFMPNLTPPEYRALCEIYPDKACIAEADDTHRLARRRIEAIGRAVGVGRGDSPNYVRRQAETAHTP